jgi:dolichyl-phosphate-mannose-protein mannosyltransferase
VLALVVLGVVLRTRSLGFPGTFLWDEHHFVENARNYLDGAADTNDHPPLGKLIMAGFLSLLGDRPEGWRAGAWLAGILTIVCGGLAVARLFRDVAAGFIAAALLSADGFFIGYSRTALLDGYLVLSVTLALILVTLPSGVTTALAAGVLCGAATCIKFSGIGLFVPLLIFIALDRLTFRKRVAHASLLLAAGVVTYLALFALGLAVAGQPGSLFAVVDRTIELYEHHAKLTDMKHPMTSGWSTWWLPVRPLVMANFDKIDHARVLSSLGNLAVWWSSFALAVTIVATLAWHGVKGAALSPPETVPDAPPSVRNFVGAHGRAVLCSLGASLGFLAPWVMSHRDSYIYHFLPSYVGFIVLLSGFLGFARERYRVHVLGFLVLVLLVGAFYAPVWSLMPMSHDAVRARLFLPGWR